MVTLNSWRPLAVLLLFGCFFVPWLLAPTVLRADDDFLDAYKEGLKALEDQRWDLAADKMRQALAGRSEESGKLIKKGYFRKYLPHYYLGVAHYELGDCESALTSWAESEGQGVVTKRDAAYEDLLDYRDQCQARAEFAEYIAPLERQLTEFESKVARRSDSTEGPVPQTIRDKLQATRTRLDRARSQADADLLPKVVDLLAEVRREWSTFEQRAASQPAPKRPPRPSEAPEQPRSQPGQAPNSPTRETEPPAELDSAVRAYLDGDYPKVIESLGEFSSEESTTMAQVHLLRSAALLALHRIRGDAELLVLARAEASAAQAADPEMTLPTRFFSTAFRELFYTVNSSNSSDGED